MQTERMTILARTWNGNESGLLWEKLWMRDEQGYVSKLVASGVFVPPIRYATEAEMWEAFVAQRAEFHGERTGAGKGHR